jgi:hypothetical protein
VKRDAGLIETARLRSRLVSGPIRPRNEFSHFPGSSGRTTAVLQLDSLTRAIILRPVDFFLLCKSDRFLMQTATLMSLFQRDQLMTVRGMKRSPAGHAVGLVHLQQTDLCTCQ